MIIFALVLVLLRIAYSIGEVCFERDWPRNTWRGLLTSLVLLGLCASAFGQAARVDLPLLTSGPNVPSIPGPLPQALWVANSTVYLCTHNTASDTSLAWCQANPITTYTDSTAGTTCPSTAQMTQLPGNTCTASSGITSNVGAWYQGGSFDYWLVTSYGTYGPFTGQPGSSALPFGCSSPSTGDITCTNTITAGQLGALVQASQQSGSAWGEKILNCFAAAQAAGSNICDARGLTGAQVLDQNLTFTPSNASGMTLLIPANLTVNQSGYTVTVNNGVQNFSITGSEIPSNVGGTPGGAVFEWCGSGFGWSLQDYAGAGGLGTQNIYFSNFGLITTTNTCNSSGGLYLGARIMNVVLDKMRISLPTSGSNTQPSLKLNGYVSAYPGIYSQQLAIHDSYISGGTGVLETGLGLDEWGQVHVDGNTHIYASNNTKITGVTGITGTGTAALTVFNNGGTYASSTVTVASGVFVSATPLLNNQGTWSAAPTTASCTGVSGSAVCSTVNVTTNINSFQACVTIQYGEFTMVATDLENCYYGVYSYAANQFNWIRPDGCCTTYGVGFDAGNGGGFRNQYYSTNPVNTQVNSAFNNSVISPSVGDVNGLNFSPGSQGAGTIVKQYIQDAAMNFDLASGTTSALGGTGPKAVNLCWGDGSTGSLVSDWCAYKDANGNWHLEDVVNSLNRISVGVGGQIGLTGNVSAGQNDGIELDYNTGITPPYELAAYGGTTSRVFSLTPAGVLAVAAGITYGGALKGPSARKGTFTCTSGGTITVSNTNETATSDVIISLNAQGGTISTAPAMKTVTAGTGFSVLCATLDTSTYNYNILN